MTVATFSQLNLVTRDLAASLAFYRHLGLTAEAAPDGIHASARPPGGPAIEWDTEQFAAQWDSGSRGATGGATVLGFSVPTRQSVDELYAELTSGGYRGHQQPYDACWGSRYAIVDDPDGNPVGLMSPRSPELQHWPPRQAPAT